MSSDLPPALGSAAGAPARRHALKQLLSRNEPCIVPGVVDALGAVIAEQVGFECFYLTGAGITNTALGMPDVGLITLDMLVTQSIRAIGATSIPVIVDIDTGFGGPTSVMHTVRTLEAVGVSAVQLEDQTMPKRCGHFERKAVVGVADMQRKIDAATRARSDDNFVIIARTDAIAIEGFEAAVARAKAYGEAGADVLFVEAPTDSEQLRAIPQLLADWPHLVNVVEGGKTPNLPAAELGRLGYRLVLYANVTMRAMAHAAYETLANLRATGQTEQPAVPFLSWQRRQGLVRLDDFDAIEDELTKRWPAS